MGLGDEVSRNEFTFVEKLKDKNVSKVFAGGHHCWFLLDFEKPYVPNYIYPSPNKPLSKTEKRKS